MKHIIKTGIFSMALLIAGTAFAGNKDRAGQAGASHLLINPWARSSGWGGAGAAYDRGLEGQFMNVASLAFTKQTEIVFAHTRWLEGAGISINTAGIAQNLGKTRGVIGLTFSAMSFGDIPVTTVDKPEGTGATYSPRYLNIGVSYARSFSKRIHGGITARVINEALGNVSANGFTIDAGVSYTASIGKKADADEFNNLIFGISLKNVGPKMRYIGDGLDQSVTLPNGAELTAAQKSAAFEMPALMNLSAMYRFRIKKEHIISAAFNFTTNSFTKDQFILGLEYNWKDILMLRGGYTFENGIFSGNRDALNSSLTNAFTGPSCGATVDIPLGKTTEEKKVKPKFGLDYSFRSTYNFKGVHTFGARITL